MRGMLFVVVSFVITILCWGMYGPVLHWGQEGMSDVAGQYARLRPFICVGLAYFAIGVIVPAVLLKTKGENGSWTSQGAMLSLFAGALGAIGALGIIMAFTFGGRPSYVMPLVFSGAPVVNSFLTIYLTKKFNEIGPLFLTGLVMVILGAATVLIFKPAPAKKVVAAPTAEQTIDATATDGTTAKEPGTFANLKTGSFNLVMRTLSIATVVLCWGAYGPTLHKGQAAMQNSRMRPLLCVGLAYFAIAVVVPSIWLGISPEASSYSPGGTFWSLAAGAAGAVGALGIIMAFNFGGKPVYVMPLVFGGAPVVNSFFTLVAQGTWSQVSPLFLAGLILAAAGAAMVLVFAPKGGPPKKPVVDAEPAPSDAPEASPA